MSGPLEAAIRAHLVSGAPAPAELLRLPQPELAMLRALCRNSPSRGAVAAEGLVGLVGLLGRAGDPGASRSDPALGADAVTGAAADGVQPPEESQDRSPAPARSAAGLRQGEADPAKDTYTELLSPSLGDGVASGWREELAEVRGAVLAVQALEEELAAFAPLLGIGWHRAGTALVSVLCDRLGDLRAVLSRAPELRRLAELLGRSRQSLQSGLGAERGGRVTAVGVKVGGGLEDALASELALLADPQTEDLFLTRLLERRLVSLEMTGEDEGDPAKPQRRRGPAIVLVDTSGSMLGNTSELAKAVALAVVERLSAERRPVELALFGGEGAMKVTRFAERKTSPNELFDFLMTSFCGGTDFDGPLSWALDRVEPTRELHRTTSLREADLLLVTDGRARLKKATKERLGAARRAGLQLVIAYVDHGLGFDPRGFANLADRFAVATAHGLTLLPGPEARRP